MDTQTLKQILLEEMEKYTGEGLNSISYLAVSEENSLYTVIDYAIIKGKQYVDAVLVARLMDDVIHIDLDQNTPPLFEALVARGIKPD
jgi:translation initiation factor IF-2